MLRCIDIHEGSMYLKIYLDSRNFDQKEFANAIGISPGAVSNYISGTRKPTLKIGRMIERYTKGKVTIDDMLDFYELCKKDAIEKKSSSRMEESRV
jgi:predicted transcriptional regulator